MTIDNLGSDEDIISENYEYVSGTLRARFPNLTEDQYAEALHMGMVSAASRYKIGQGASPGTWLCTRVLGYAVDLIRRHGPKTRKGLDRPQEFTVSENKYHCAGNSNLEDAVTRIIKDENIGEQEVRETIERLCLELKPREQKILRLLYYKGLSITEISEILDLSPERMYQLRNKIREAFTDLLERGEI